MEFTDYQIKRIKSLAKKGLPDNYDGRQRTYQNIKCVACKSIKPKKGSIRRTGIMRREGWVCTDCQSKPNLSLRCNRENVSIPWRGERDERGRFSGTGTKNQG